MNVYVKPEKLIKTKQHVISIHTKTAKRTLKDNVDELKELILRIIKIPASKICSYAELLSPLEVTSLCNYVSNNQYNVKCDNIFEVIRCKAIADDYKNLFEDWQRHYSNENVKVFLANLYETKKEFREMLKSESFEIENVKKWLAEKDIVSYISKEYGYGKSKEIYEKILRHRGIISATRLHKDCMEAYLLFCDQKAYLTIGDNQIANAYMSFDSSKKWMLFINVLKELQIKHLIGYEELYEAIEDSSVVHQKDFMNILENHNLLQKYLAWKNIFTTKRGLEDTERVEFWIQYALCADMTQDGEYLKIDFGDIIVVEFKKKAAGPAYFYTKEYFRTQVNHRMKYKSVPEFKSWAYGCFKTKMRPTGCLERLVHSPNPGWTYIFKRCLNGYGKRPTIIN